MSTIVFLNHKIPERGLISELIYRVHPDSKIKNIIISDIQKHLNRSVEDYSIDINITCTLKEYEKKYSNSDTKNS